MSIRALFSPPSYNPCLCQFKLVTVLHLNEIIGHIMLGLLVIQSRSLFFISYHPPLTVAPFVFNHENRSSAMDIQKII